MKINNCPSSLLEGFTTYTPKASNALFGKRKVSPLLDFDFEGIKASTDVTDAMHLISVSGVQEKFPAIVQDGKIRLTVEGEQSTHILKPAPWDNTLAARKQIPANEHLTMQIAAQVYGIQTAVNGLCFTKSGQIVYITKRFDINVDGSKLLMEDFASVVGRNEQTDGLYFKYNGSYEDIAVAIRRNVAAWRVDMERFFELVLFNYIYGNSDDHLKNFSLIRQGDDLRLAPAYDLLNTGLHVEGSDFGLDGGLSPNIVSSDVLNHTHHACRLDFDRFGQHIGIVKPRLKRILDKYIQIPESAIMLTHRSFLNEKMQRTYLRIVNERIKRFVRESA